MVNVRKSSGEIQEFVKEKISTACQKAGATVEQGVDVAEKVASQIVDKVEVTSKELRDMVINSLKDVNEKAAEAYENFKKEVKD